VLGEIFIIKIRPFRIPNPAICFRAFTEFHISITMYKTIIGSLSITASRNLQIFVSIFYYELDARMLYFNTFIILLYMFRARLCSSLGGQIVYVQHLVPSLSLGDCVLNSYLKGVTVPDAVHIQSVLLKMSIIVLETCREV